MLGLDSHTIQSFFSSFGHDHVHDAGIQDVHHDHQHVTNFYTFIGSSKAKVSTSFKAAEKAADADSSSVEIKPTKKKGPDATQGSADQETPSKKTEDSSLLAKASKLASSSKEDADSVNPSKKAEDGGLAEKSSKPASPSKEDADGDK